MALQNKLGLTEEIALARAEEKLSKQKALALYDTGLLDTFPVGTFAGLAKIHAYLFGEIYDFAGQLRTVNIAKGNFRFAPVIYLHAALKGIDAMPQSTFDQIIEKYVEMNVAQPLPGRQWPQHPHLAGLHPEKRAASSGGLEPRGQGGLSSCHGAQPHQGSGDQDPAACGADGSDQ